MFRSFNFNWQQNILSTPSQMDNNNKIIIRMHNRRTDIGEDSRDQPWTAVTQNNNAINHDDVVGVGSGSGFGGWCNLEEGYFVCLQSTTSSISADSVNRHNIKCRTNL